MQRNLHKKPKGRGLECFKVDKHLEMWGEWRTWRRHGSSVPFLHASPYVAVGLYPLSYYLINWSSKLSVSLSSMSHSCKSREPTKKVIEISNLAGWSEAQVTGTWICCWHMMRKGDSFMGLSP